MTDSSSSTGIEVKPSFFILFFVYYLFPPIVTIDGVETKVKWNDTTFIPAAPGAHQVDIMFKFYWFLPAGKASTNVTVPASGTVTVNYKPPFWAWFLKGKIDVA